MTILVPYRDREEHLKEFVLALGDKHDIVVIEQADDKPFNRGKLINVGFLETWGPGVQGYFCVHDVDMIPLDVNYSANSEPTVIQLTKSEIQPYNYLGGVTMFWYKGFADFGGFHNDYFHRAEDNELMFHLRRLNIPVLNRFGQFKTLQHPRSGPEFIPELWQKAQLPRTKNMLETCEYQLISKELKEGYTLIKVLL